MNNEKQNYYFTFGIDHERKGKSLKDYYVKIYGTSKEARLKMQAIHGNKWSSMYIDSEFLPLIKKWDLKEYKRGDL